MSAPMNVEVTASGRGDVEGAAIAVPRRMSGSNGQSNGAPATWRLVVPFVALLVGFYLYPLLVLILGGVLAVTVARRDWKWVFLLASCLLFTVLNASKSIEGDLVNYVNLQQYLSGRSILVLLEASELRSISASYRPTEVGFYGPLWLMANLLPSEKSAIAAFATLGTYVPTFIGLLLISRGEKWNVRLTLVVAYFVFFAAINFVQTTHLLRQYVSSAVAFLALALFVRGMPKKAVFVALAACSIHNATAVLVVAFISLALLFPYQMPAEMRIASVAARVITAILVLAALFAFVAWQQFLYIGVGDPNISWGHYVIVGALLVLYLLYARARYRTTRLTHAVTLASCMVFIFSFGFFMLGAGLLALRYFAYLEWLLGLLVAGILCSIPRRRIGLYLASRWAVCSSATLIMLFRIANAPWSYGSGDLSIFEESAGEIARSLRH